jgi:hypothetical protein
VEIRGSNVMAVLTLLMLMTTLTCRSTLKYDRLDISGPGVQLTGMDDDEFM